MKIAPYVVAFLDLLGLSAEILKEEEDPSHLFGRAGKFSIIKAHSVSLVEAAIGTAVENRWLSDTLIVARHVESLETTCIETALREVSIAVGSAQCRFASEDYFSRGGIAIGRMMQARTRDGSYGPGLHEELFGAGLVRAAELEKLVAKYPRVVVSARLAAPSLQMKAPLNDRPLYRWDIELPYLDYLSLAEVVWRDHPDQIIAGHAEMVHNLVVHSERVPSLRGKAAWLLEYHNWHVESRGGLEHLTVNMPAPDPTAPPSDPVDEHSGPEIFRLRAEALRPTESWRRGDADPTMRKDDEPA